MEVTHLFQVYIDSLEHGLSVHKTFVYLCKGMKIHLGRAPPSGSAIIKARHVLRVEAAICGQSVYLFK